jgi:hypothetical protein
MVIGMEDNKNPHPCPFNGAVVCVVQIFCDRCGWNPKVAEERLNRITQDHEDRRDPR